MRKSLKILVLLTVITFSSIGFKNENKYDPFLIVIKGTAINITSNKSIKNTGIYIDNKRLDEIDFNPNDILIKEGKTKFTGQFTFRYYIDKSNRHFWIKIEEFAQINIKNIPIDTTKLWDTLDLGNVYFVPYDNELKIEAYNMPKEYNPQKKSKYKTLDFKTIDSIFSINSSKYNMTLNPTDTINGSITRYNFGHNKPRGTTIKSYKILTFSRDLK